MAFTDKSEFNVPRHIVQKGGVNPETIILTASISSSETILAVLTAS
jgi:hypothetical protein